MEAILLSHWHDDVGFGNGIASFSLLIGNIDFHASIPSKTKVHLMSTQMIMKLRLMALQCVLDISPVSFPFSCGTSALQGLF